MYRFGTKRPVRYRSWRLRGNPQVVEYAQSVLEEILSAVTRAQGEFPDGGLEIGGVLFGTSDKHLARILATRPIVCEHAYGPQFLLSGKDHELLGAQLADASHDAELDGLVPIGWYVARAREDLTLRKSDRQLHSRHFQRGWPVVLVFEATEGGTTRLAVFGSGNEGVLPAEPAHRVEKLGAPSAPPASGRTTEPAVASKPDDDPEPPADAVRRALGAPSGLSEGVRQPPRRLSRKVAGLTAVGLAALAAAWIFRVQAGGDAAVYWSKVTSYWTAPPETEVGAPPTLWLEATGDRLTIRWDPTRGILQVARRATLAIQDGDQRTDFELDEAGILQGSMAYQRSMTDVRVKLEVTTDAGSTVVETARFLGAVPVQDAGGAQVADGAAEIERLQTALRAEAGRREELMVELRTLDSLAASRPASGSETPASPAPPVLAEKAPAVQPPATVSLEQRPPAAPTRGAPSGATATRAGVGARVGMLIWTGLLSDGRTLSIQDGRASSGSLSGVLPGTPVRITAYPAELGGDGLMLVSGEERHRAQAVVEEPGPQNSWNRTTFRYDPAAASSLVLVEAPTDANGWNRLTLRANGGTVSVVAIRWERIQ